MCRDFSSYSWQSVFQKTCRCGFCCERDHTIGRSRRIRKTNTKQRTIDANEHLHTANQIPSTSRQERLSRYFFLNMIFHLCSCVSSSNVRRVSFLCFSCPPTKHPSLLTASTHTRYTRPSPFIFLFHRYPLHMGNPMCHMFLFLFSLSPRFPTQILHLFPREQFGHQKTWRQYGDYANVRQVSNTFAS